MNNKFLHNLIRNTIARKNGAWFMRANSASMQAAQDLLNAGEIKWAGSSRTQVRFIFA